VRKNYIVAYDVSDPRRLARVSRACLDFGERIQKSVFHCHMHEGERVMLWGRLERVIDKAQDQVLFIRLGTVKDSDTAVTSLGKPYESEDRVVIIV